ncbi:hypothetical protein L1887_54490 [Cichorium endivia]|nr:hypothetical protein L1887_54490 [Cichorium endivia]
MTKERELESFPLRFGAGDWGMMVVFDCRGRKIMDGAQRRKLQPHTRADREQHTASPKCNTKFRSAPAALRVRPLLCRHTRAAALAAPPPSSNDSLPSLSDPLTSVCQVVVHHGALLHIYGGRAASDHLCGQGQVRERRTAQKKAQQAEQKRRKEEAEARDYSKRECHQPAMTCSCQRPDASDLSRYQIPVYSAEAMEEERRRKEERRLAKLDGNASGSGDDDQDDGMDSDDSFMSKREQEREEQSRSERGVVAGEDQGRGLEDVPPIGSRGAGHVKMPTPLPRPSFCLAP